MKAGDRDRVRAACLEGLMALWLSAAHYCPGEFGAVGDGAALQVTRYLANH